MDKEPKEIKETNVEMKKKEEDQRYIIFKLQKNIMTIKINYQKNHIIK